MARRQRQMSASEDVGRFVVALVAFGLFVLFCLAGGPQAFGDTFARFVFRYIPTGSVQQPGAC